MTTKSLLRAMTLIAAAGAAITVLLPFLEKPQETAPSRRRSVATRRSATTSASAKEVAEKAARSTRAKRAGNGGPPSHH